MSNNRFSSIADFPAGNSDPDAFWSEVVSGCDRDDSLPLKNDQELMSAIKEHNILAYLSENCRFTQSDLNHR